MRVVAYFENGMIREFNTETFCAAEPFKVSNSSATVCCEFVLRLDELTDGLRLNIFWYDGNVEADTRYLKDTSGAGVKIPIAARRVGTAYLLLTKDEMQELSCLEVDGKETLVKEGSGFINMLRFNDCMNKYVNEAANNKSDNALQLYSILHGRMSDEEIFEKIGMSEEIFTSLVGEIPAAALVSDTPDTEDTPEDTDDKNEQSGDQEDDTENQERESEAEEDKHQETPDETGDFNLL